MFSLYNVVYQLYFNFFKCKEITHKAKPIKLMGKLMEQESKLGVHWRLSTGTGVGILVWLTDDPPLFPCIVPPTGIASVLRSSPVE